MSDQELNEEIDYIFKVLALHSKQDAKSLLLNLIKQVEAQAKADAYRQVMESLNQ